MTQNEITFEKSGDVTVFDIKGDVTRASGPFFEEAYKEAATEQKQNMLLKFHEESYFNSEGINVLIQLLAETKKNEQRVAVTGLSEHFKNIFHMVEIAGLAAICESQEEAMESLGVIEDTP